MESARGARHAEADPSRSDAVHVAVGLKPTDREPEQGACRVATPDAISRRYATKKEEEENVLRAASRGLKPTATFGLSLRDNLTAATSPCLQRGKLRRGGILTHFSMLEALRVEVQQYGQ